MFTIFRTTLGFSNVYGAVGFASDEGTTGWSADTTPPVKFGAPRDGDIPAGSLCIPDGEANDWVSGSAAGAWSAGRLLLRVRHNFLLRSSASLSFVAADNVASRALQCSFRCAGVFSLVRKCLDRNWIGVHDAVPGHMRAVSGYLPGGSDISSARMACGRCLYRMA